MAGGINHIEQTLLTLRNVLDGLLEEVRALKPQETPPCKRRNLKAQRVQEMTANLMRGTWRKPAELKKKR